MSVLQARATVTTIASGLVNPRGLNFGPDGALYVAEAGSGGSGPCILGSDGLMKCYGTTGAVTKDRAWQPGEPCRHRPSVDRGITRHHGSGHRQPGPHDVDFQGLGNGFVTIGLRRRPGQAAGSGIRERRAASSVGLCASSRMANGPSKKIWRASRTIANPRRRRAAGLQSVRPARRSRAHHLHGRRRQFAQRCRGQWFDFEPGRVSPRRSAVSTLPGSSHLGRPGPRRSALRGAADGRAFPGGAARSIACRRRRNADDLRQTGFTKIIDIAFGKDGSLYVLEISAPAGAPPFGPPGALLRIPPGGGTPVDITPTVTGGFVAPGGIAVGSDGALYITVNSISATAGFVIKVVE